MHVWHLLDNQTTDEPFDTPEAARHPQQSLLATFTARLGSESSDVRTFSALFRLEQAVQEKTTQEAPLVRLGTRNTTDVANASRNLDWALTNQETLTSQEGRRVRLLTATFRGSCLGVTSLLVRSKKA